MAKPLGVLIQSTSAAGKSTLMDAYYKMGLARLAPGRLRGVSPRGNKAQEQAVDFFPLKC